MTLKYEILEDPILVFIKNENDEIVVSQPHHPEALEFAPWESTSDAQAWAVEYITGRAAEEEKAREEVASLVDAELPVEAPVEE